MEFEILQTRQTEDGASGSIREKSSHSRPELKPERRRIKKTGEEMIRHIDAGAACCHVVEKCVEDVVLGLFAYILAHMVPPSPQYFL